MHYAQERAIRLAEDVLFPAATGVDVSGLVPRSSFDALAEAGFYGLFAPPEAGGLGADLPTTCAVVETLASGCLATTFVWAQHFSLLRSLLRSRRPECAGWLAEACRGERRGGIAFGGLLPGPPLLRARPDGGSWVLGGVAPWVSGWDAIDTLQVAARGPDDTVVHAAVDAVEGGGLGVEPQRLAALDATATVRLTFDAVAVPRERVLRTEPFDPAASGGTSLRLNGSLALGVTRRCCALLGPTGLDGELDAARAELDGAGAAAMASARARASELALRASAALMVAQGSRAILAGEHASRLAREALFLLVFGSRPEIKRDLLARLQPGAQA